MIIFLDLPDVEVEGVEVAEESVLLTESLAQLRRVEQARANASEEEHDYSATWNSSSGINRLPCLV
jgi:hypothetical protein